LAQTLHFPYAILHYETDIKTLRQRVRQRMEKERDASDATLQVLEQQITTREILDNEELSKSISINTEQEINIPQLLKKIRHVTQA
jgi:hypothetical protein